MTGRGIDQILPYPSDPAIHERYVQSALGYVQIAEEKNGPIPRSVDPSYIWGDALEELDRVKPDARIVNLETAVTRSDDWLDKGINYRMNPGNIACLSAAAIDCCALANNHVLDWGAPGLIETLDALHAAGLKTAGAGRNRLDAQAPAELPVGDNRRVLVFSLGAESGGVPANWAATDRAPGVDFLADLSQRTVPRRSRLHVLPEPRRGDGRAPRLGVGSHADEALPRAAPLRDRRPLVMLHSGSREPSLRCLGAASGESPDRA